MCKFTYKGYLLFCKLQCRVPFPYKDIDFKLFIFLPEKCLFMNTDDGKTDLIVHVRGKSGGRYCLPKDILNTLNSC